MSLLEGAAPGAAGGARPAQTSRRRGLATGYAVTARAAFGRAADRLYSSRDPDRPYGDADSLLNAGSSSARRDAQDFEPMFGWRKRIGYIGPTVMEVVPYEFYRFAPDGVGLVGVTCSVEDWTSDQFERGIGQVTAGGGPFGPRRGGFLS